MQHGLPDMGETFVNQRDFRPPRASDRIAQPRGERKPCNTAAYNNDTKLICHLTIAPNPHAQRHGPLRNPPLRCNSCTFAPAAPVGNVPCPDHVHGLLRDSPPVWMRPAGPPRPDPSIQDPMCAEQGARTPRAHM